MAAGLNVAPLSHQFEVGLMIGLPLLSLVTFGCEEQVGILPPFGFVL
jgi:hypothetical protein